MKFKFVLATVLFYGYHVAAQSASESTKCRIGNSTCEMASYVRAKNMVILNGSPQLGIPQLNPLHITDMDVSFLDKMVTATLIDGYYYGIDNCKLIYYVTNATTLRKIAKIKCDQVDIRGFYKITTDPIFSQLLGNVYGCGNVSISAKDWYYELDYGFKFVKHNDGQIYTEPDFKAGTYISKVLTKLTVAFDNIMLDDRDITENVVSFINKYWELVLDTVGKPFHEAALGVYFEIYDKFFRGVPATNFYIDDLEPYLSENQCVNRNI